MKPSRVINARSRLGGRGIALLQHGVAPLPRPEPPPVLPHRHRLPPAPAEFDADRHPKRPRPALPLVLPFRRQPSDGELRQRPPLLWWSVQDDRVVALVDDTGDQRRASDVLPDREPALLVQETADLGLRSPRQPLLLVFLGHRAPGPQEMPAPAILEPALVQHAVLHPRLPLGD